MSGKEQFLDETVNLDETKHFDQKKNDDDPPTPTTPITATTTNTTSNLHSPFKLRGGHFKSSSNAIKLLVTRIRSSVLPNVEQGASKELPDEA